MREVVKTYPDKHGVSVRGAEWSLWVRRVKTRDKRVMFVLKPLEVHYSGNTHNFNYEELKSPIWLNPSDLNKLVEELRDLSSSTRTMQKSKIS